MRAECFLGVAVALATVACTPNDGDVVERALPGFIGPGTGAESDLADPSVVLIGEISLPTMRSAASLAVDAEGTIFITDLVTSMVHKVSAHGDRLMSFAVGSPQGIAVDGSGRLYVSDASAGAVRIFSVHGEPIGFLGTGEGYFERPTALAWDPTEDSVLVADSDAGNVQVFDTAGSPRFVFGSRGAGPGQFARVSGIAVDVAGGRYFVADAGNNRIEIFDRDGAFLAEFGSRGTGKTQLTAPGGIAVDAVGRIYVSDAYQSILQVLDDEGKHVSYLGEYGHHYGQLRLSSDVVLDRFNRLLVASYKSKKVVIYGIDEHAQPPARRPPIAATLAVMPPTLNGRSRSPYLHAQIGVSELEASQILVESVRLQGLARDRSAPVSYADTDGDGVEELILRFSREALLATLPGPGPHTISLTGDFSTGDTLTGEVVVHVLAEVP